MRRALAGFLLLGLGLVLTAPSMVASPALIPTDAQILQAVQEALMSSPEAGFRGLRVRCEEGILTLGGTADTLFSLEAAVRQAGTVRGVLDVVVTATVPRRGISNVEVLADVREALGRMDSASGSIQASVGYGVVTLQGVTGTFGHKMMAEEVVSRIPGVTLIRNDIRVSTETNARAHELSRRIVSELRSGSTTIPGRIDVTMKGPVAVLRGRVPLFVHRIEAEEAALSVPGVTSLDNRLVVDPSLASPEPESR
jgi:osmotically-inducible protein OsmY